MMTLSKKTLFALLNIYLVSGFLATANAQISKTRIENLISLEIIDPADKEMFVLMCNRMNDTLPSTILELILLVEGQKFKRENNVPSHGLLGIESKYISPEAQKTINKELKKYLLSLGKAHLLNTDQISFLEIEVDKNKFALRFQLIGEASNLVRLSELNEPARLIAFSQRLHEFNIVSDSNYSKLTKAIEEGKITSNSALFPYFENAVYFDLTQYSDSPAVYIPQIFKTTAELCPELPFSQFEFIITPDVSSYLREPNSILVTKSKCTVNISDTTFFPLYNSNIHLLPDGILPEKLSPYFYGLFNKQLAYYQSEKRFRLIQFPGGNRFTGPDGHRFGIIVLEKWQEAAFKKNEVEWILNSPSYDNMIPPARIDSILKIWEDNGLFTHMQPGEVSNIVEKIKNKLTYFYSSELIEEFQPVVFKMTDYSDNAKEPYRNLLNNLSNISHGVFNPTEIQDGFQNPKDDSVKISFVFNKKEYSIKLVHYNMVLSHEFLMYIQSVLKENQVEGKFYTLKSASEGFTVIFLLPSQFHSLSKSGTLEFYPEK